jgi:ABC-type nitrate/sulfonate/bicarbonate transport system ATPase subunit
MSPYSYNKEEVILSVRDLSLSFGAETILKDINITVRNITRPGMQQGQVIALLGPSGIGKTQLFRCLAGHQKPTSGSISVTDKLIPVQVGMVGVVAQTYPLFRRRTVLSNLIFAAELHGYRGKEAAEKAMSALAVYGLADKADKYPTQLSGGQRQRVAIAQQVVSSDHFLLMDEPFSGLDPIAKERACEAILGWSRVDELNTTIVVTHDVESAVAISDTVLLMGRQIQSDGKNLGSTIIREYDLIECGLAWHPDIQKMPEFHRKVVEIKEDFRYC